MKLSDLDLHPNVVAALGREGLVNLSDVENMTEEELDAIDGVGLSSARVIVDGVEQWKKDRREPEESLDGEPPEPVHERREGEEEGPVGVLPEGEGVDDGTAPAVGKVIGRSMTEEEEREAMQNRPMTMTTEEEREAMLDAKPSTGGLPWSPQQLQHICALDREMGRIMPRPAFNYVNGLWQGNGTPEQLAKANGFSGVDAAEEQATLSVRQLFEHFSLLRARDLL